MTSRSWQALLCLLVLAAPAAAQTPRYNTGSPTLQQIFVDPARGDDRASGRTSSEPIRSLTEAWNRIPRNSVSTALVAGGYEIQLMPGEYPASGIHVLEAGFGARSCDAADVESQRAACQSRIAAGAWGTTAVDDGDNFVRIPNHHVFVFNPDGAASQWQQFQVGGAYPNAGGAGSPSSTRADNDLRIAGNVIWNGPAGHALGLGDDGCQGGHPTCSETYVRANNQINTRQPSFADLSNRDVRPAGSLLNERSVTVPDFDWSDMPSRPQAPAGERSNRIAFDRNGRARGASDPPGAAIP